MEIFKLLGTIAINTDAANKALDDTKHKATDTSNETQSAFSKIGGAALNIGKTVMTAGAALGTAWIAAIEGTREYRTHLGMLDTAFHNSGLSSSAARQAFASALEMKILPSSSMSILTSHSAQIFWMVLPPEPITSRILSVSILMVSILGAYLESSALGSEIAGAMISSRI